MSEQVKIKTPNITTKVWAYTISDSSGIGAKELRYTEFNAGWHEDDVRGEILYSTERWALGTRFASSAYLRLQLVDKPDIAAATGRDSGAEVG